jgi:hypothetical protein
LSADGQCSFCSVEWSFHVLIEISRVTETSEEVSSHRRIDLSNGLTVQIEEEQLLLDTDNVSDWYARQACLQGIHTEIVCQNVQFLRMSLSRYK